LNLSLMRIKVAVRAFLNTPRIMNIKRKRG